MYKSTNCLISLASENYLRCRSRFSSFNLRLSLARENAARGKSRPQLQWQSQLKKHSRAQQATVVPSLEQWMY
jgi:hypothetical protein